MKKIVFIPFLAICLSPAAQISINKNSEAHQSAVLEIMHQPGSPKGLLIPKMEWFERLAIPSPADGLLVYQNNIDEGFYYYRNGSWQQIPTGSSSWGVSGNAGLNSLHFIGTTDGAALRFVQNNQNAGVIKTQNKVTVFGSSTISNANGEFNSAFGTGALKNLLNGNHNIAIGVEALGSLDGESGNLAIGDSSMFFYSSSGVPNSFNTVVGFKALKTPVTAYGNTVIGGGAMELAAGNPHSNTVMGYDAMANGSGGDYNVAIGRDALINASGANYNVTLGYSTGSTITTGDKNIFIGYNADASANNLLMASAIGYNAVVGDDSTMAFGTADYKAYAFGRSTTANSSMALQVGLNGAVVPRGNGAYLTNGGVWTNTSDVNSKEDFSELNNQELLKRILQLPVTRWRYKGTSEYHIGPTAQDFHAMFKTGIDNKTISTIDPSGVALAAIKVLIKQNKDLQKQIDELKLLLKRRN